MWRVIVKYLSSKYTKLVLLELVVLVGVLVVVEDLNTEYVWVYPSSEPREVASLYAKSSTTIALIDLESDKRTLVVLSGVSTSTVIGECSTCYAIVVASGVNFYVLLFTITLTISAGLVIHVESVTKPLVILLLCLYISALTIVYLYIKAGEGLGYTVKPHYSRLAQIDLEDRGFQSVTIVEDNTIRILRRHAYGFRERVKDLSLVHIRVQRVENEDILVLLNTTTSITTAQESATLYIESGELEILVLSDREVFNSTIEYYKLEFKEQETLTPLYFEITVLLVLVQCAVITTRFIKTLTRKQRETSISL